MRPPLPPIPGEPVRILHVVRPAVGGIRQHVLELLRRTDPAHFSVSVAGPTDFLHGLPADLPVTNRLMLDIAPKFSPARDLLAAARLAQYARGQVNILLHAHGLRAAFVAALAHRLRPFPLVFTAHNLVPGGHLTQLGIRSAGQSADRVIAISQSVADGLMACGIPLDKITIIPNGVDTKYFAPQPLKRKGSDSEFVVGCVARLSREKGVDVLLRAAAMLRAGAMPPNVRFLIAGDGPEREALEASSPPTVQWLGRVEDTRKVYGASDVIVVPSRQEGQGIVALEAMASGVPLIASRIGGLAEMLTDNETASLVRPDDPAALVDALALLQVASTRRRLAANARVLVKARYDVRQMVHAVQGVYAATASTRFALGEKLPEGRS